MTYLLSLTRQQVHALLDGDTLVLGDTLEITTTADPPWKPMERFEVNPDMHAALLAADAVPSAAYWNGLYDCFVYEHASGITHLSIKRLDRAPIRNWRHFQQIKNEICGPEREALEIYPRESRLTDSANQYHLFVMPEGMDIPFGYPEGMVLMDDADVEAFNRNRTRARQEPLQEGLTVGATLSGAPLKDPEAEAKRQAVIRGDLS